MTEATNRLIFPWGVNCFENQLFSRYFIYGIKLVWYLNLNINKTNVLFISLILLMVLIPETYL